MPSFDCLALDENEAPVTLRLVAENRAGALRMLEIRGLAPLSVEDYVSVAQEERRPSSLRISARDTELFAAELSALLQAGIGLSEALDFLAEDAPSVTIHWIAKDLASDIRAGVAFSKAIAHHPAGFSSLVEGLAIAGEATGALGSALDQIAQQARARRELFEDVRAKLAYPAFLLTGSIASVVFLATTVFPSFQSILSNNGSDLPPLTAVIFAVGDFIRDRGLLILALVVAATAALVAGSRNPGLNLKMWRFALRLPLVGSILRDYGIAQFANVLAGLLAGGVRLVAALDIARTTLGNPVLRGTLDRVRRAVQNGERLSDALEYEPMLPTRFVHMLRIGERSGDLEAMTARAGQFYAIQVRRRLAALIGLITPLTTLLIGVIIALMIGGLMTALLNLTPGAG